MLFQSSLLLLSSLLGTMPPGVQNHTQNCYFVTGFLTKFATLCNIVTKFQPIREKSKVQRAEIVSPCYLQIIFRVQ
jgi:hypothetical protein